jgi:hypothetical protein
VADRLIKPDEEITYDYGKQYLEFFLDTGGCKCAACRRKRALKRRRTRLAAKELAAKELAAKAKRRKARASARRR